MKCPKCNHEIEKISHALNIRLADSFDNEMKNVEKNGKLRLRVLDAGTPDTEIEHQSVSTICPYCGYPHTK